MIPIMVIAARTSTRENPRQRWREAYWEGVNGISVVIVF
jgi:hypothetical protein